MGEVKKSHQQQPFVLIGFVSLNKYVKTKMGGLGKFLQSGILSLCRSLIRWTLSQQILV